MLFSVQVWMSSRMFGQPCKSDRDCVLRNGKHVFLFYFIFLITVLINLSNLLTVICNVLTFKQYHTHPRIPVPTAESQPYRHSI